MKPVDATSHREWLVMVVAGITAFFVVCISLHSMLVDARLPAEGLSSFYLAMAAGGARGFCSTPS